jgi:hypothetical protein
MGRYRTLRLANLDEINNEIFEKLEIILGDLAGIWRRTKDEEFVTKYHLLLNCLMDMDGWKCGLDLEDFLPDELMPERFFEFIEKRRQEWGKNQHE